MNADVINIDGVALQAQYCPVDDIRWCVLRAGSGRPVILVHGFPDTPLTFRYQLRELVGQGFSVILPWLPGYAESTVTSPGYYDASRLGGDFARLIQALELDRPRFVGHDWGGIAGYQLAAQHPELISKLVTIAVPQASAMAAADLRQLWRSRYMFLFQLPGYERLIKRRNLRKLDALYREWSPSWTVPKEQVNAVKRCFDDDLTLQRAVGYYRTMFRQAATNSTVRQAMSATIGVPSLTFAGTEDGCIGLNCMQAQEQGFTGAYELAVIAHAGHFCHQEKAAQFNDRLIHFLSEDTSSTPAVKPGG